MTKAEYNDLLRMQASAIMQAHGMGRYKQRNHRRYNNGGNGHRATVGEIVRYGPPAPAKAPEPFQVYVISAPGHPVKIGIAKDPERRLTELQTGSPHRLMIHFTASVSNGRSVERACHMTLSAKRLEGEWFDITPDDAIEVVRRAAGMLAA